MIPPLLLQVWPRVYGGFSMLQGNLVCAQTSGEDDCYCAAWTSDLLSYLVVCTASPFGPVTFQPSLCLRWAAVTTEVCLLSVVQKLLLSDIYIGIENVILSWGIPVVYVTINKGKVRQTKLVYWWIKTTCFGLLRGHVWRWNARSTAIHNHTYIVYTPRVRLDDEISTSATH